MISRVPFPNCRSSVIGLAIASNPENDGHLSPWQEAVGHEIIPDTHKHRGGWPRRRRARAAVPADPQQPYRLHKALVAEGRHRGAVRHVEKTRGLPPPEPARPRTPGAGADGTPAVHARLARKPGIAPTLPCRAQQERAASFPRAGHLHLQTRPDCRPQCRGAAVSCLRPQPRHRRDRVLELHLHRRRHRPSP